MGNETEAPERVWRWAVPNSGGWIEWSDIRITSDYATEYTRADLSDAKDKRIAEYEVRLRELEAKLAKAVEIALEECPFWDGSRAYNDWWQDRRETLEELKEQNSE